MKDSNERNKEFEFEVGDECLFRGLIIVIRSLPDEFTRVSYSVKNGYGGGFMGYNHWKRLTSII